MRKQKTSPPEVAGLSVAGARDAHRIMWWLYRRLWHGVRVGHPSQWPTRGAWALATLAFLPVLWLTGYLVALRQCRRRYYLSATKDAVLAVRASKRGWTIFDHASAKPGTGQGKRLRGEVAPALIQTADAAGITIHATAATKELAAHYMAEFPGLTDVGRGFPYGRHLRRLPQTGVERHGS